MSSIDNKHIFSSFFKRKSDYDKSFMSGIPLHKNEDIKKNYAEKMLSSVCHEKSALKNLCSMYRGTRFNPFEYISESIDKDGVTFEYVYRELIDFSHELQFTARDYMAGINDYELYSSSNGGYSGTIGSKNKKPDDSVDAEIKLKISSDKLCAWVFVFPPRNGGSDITEQKLKRFLIQNNIKFGINQSNLIRICDNRDYLRVFEIARGNYPVNGRNSYLICYFAMGSQKKIRIYEDETGNLDYKDYNLACDIHKDDVICEVVPPTNGIDGTDICDMPVAASKGKLIHVPRGKNTRITEDGMKLLSEMDGQITYDNHAFNVNKVLVINGDIDSSVGNIDFSGDVIIFGSIMEGFKVVAEGSIDIKGVIDCANIISGGNIIAESGMNGGGKGRLEAKGNIIGRIFENCTVRAGGKVIADSIKYSEIYSDDTVIVNDRKGVISGGKIIAANSICVHTIGDKTNTAFTEVILGCTPKMIEQKNAFSAKLLEVSDGIEKINKNIDYIENLPPNLRNGRMALLEQLKLQIPLREMQKVKLSKMIQKINEQMNDVSRCFVESDEIYPTTIIKIGSKSSTINQNIIKVRVFIKNDEIFVEEYLDTEIV